jgi:hypothetical protein
MEKSLFYGGFMKKLLLIFTITSSTVGASMETAALCKKPKVNNIFISRFVIKKIKNYLEKIDWSELPITP